MNQKQIKQYYDGFLERLLNDFIRHNTRVVKALEHLISSMPSQCKNVLDIGCGIGWSSYELARHYPDAEIIGVDISEKLINCSQQLFVKSQLRFEIADMTATDFSYSKWQRKFDVIVMIDVFEHLPVEHRLNFYGKTNSLLTENGLIFLSFPSQSHLAYYMSDAIDQLQPEDNIVLLDDLQEWAKILGGQIQLYAHQCIWQENDYVHAIIRKGKINWGGTEKKVNPRLLNLYQRMHLINRIFPQEKPDLYHHYWRNRLKQWYRRIVSAIWR